MELEVNPKNSDDMFAFEVTPKKSTISPHDSIYAKITFKPEIMAVYKGTFVAKVVHENSSLPAGEFSFDLKGEGILPTLKIDNMGENKVIDFGRIRSEKTRIKQIIVKNIGLIPATAVCRMP